MMTGYLLPLRLSQIEELYFINYDSEVYYPCWNDNDLYMIGKSKKLKYYNTQTLKDNLNFFNNKLRRSRYETNQTLNGDKILYDHCYCCKCETELLLKYGLAENIYEIFNSSSNGSPFNDIPDYSNTLYDIGSGRLGDLQKWISSNLNVMTFDPSEENYYGANGILERMNNTKGAWDKVRPLNRGLFNEDDIKYFKSKVGSIKAGIITSFDSLTFFYSDEKSIELYMDFLTEFLYEDGGVAVIVSIDGDSVREYLEYYPDKSKINKFAFVKTQQENQVKVSLGKKSIVQDQTEYLTSMSDLRMRLENRKFKILLDYYENKELILTLDEKLYSGFTRVIVGQRYK